MEIKVNQYDDIVIVEPVGSLDTRTTHEFEKKILELLELGTRHFVIDFVTTDHLTSSGLRVLLLLAKKLSGMEGGLALCSLNDHVKTVFDISGFTDFFPIMSSQHAAIKHLSSDTKVSKISVQAMKLLDSNDDEKAPSKSHKQGKGAASSLSAQVAKLLSGSGSEPISKPSKNPQKGSPKSLDRMKDWLKGKQ